MFGCTGAWKTVAQPGDSAANGTESSGSAEKIGYLYIKQGYGAAASQDWYDVQFTLEDADGNVVTDNGTAEITLKDDEDKILYSGSAAVSDADFDKSSGYPFYDNKVFTHKVMFSGIAKSQTDYADLEVTYTSSGGKTIKQNRSVFLAYDLVNYTYNYSDVYDGELHNLTGSSTVGDVQVKLVKGGTYGYYNDYEIDLDVKNAGSLKKEITITDAALVMDGRQYEASSLYGLELGNVYPGAAVSKTLTFYDVGEAGADATLYLELEIWENGGTSGKKVQMQIPFKP